MISVQENSVFYVLRVWFAKCRIAIGTTSIYYPFRAATNTQGVTSITLYFLQMWIYRFWKRRYEPFCESGYFLDQHQLDWSRLLAIDRKQYSQATWGWIGISTKSSPWKSTHRPKKINVERPKKKRNSYLVKNVQLMPLSNAATVVILNCLSDFADWLLVSIVEIHSTRDVYFWLAKQPKDWTEQSWWQPKLDIVWKSICRHSLVPLELKYTLSTTNNTQYLKKASHPWLHRRHLLARKLKLWSFYLF